MSISFMTRVISFSRPVAVLTPDDTPESLASKIHKLEYRYFPEVIEKLVAGLP